ncbi:TPA: hypothetical protein ACX6QR_003939 [Photobacterium damselae]
MRIFILSFLFILLSSPLYPIFTGVQSSYIYVFLAIIYITFYVRKKIIFYEAVIYIGLMALFLLLSIIHEDARIAFNGFYFILTLYIAARINRSDFLKLVEVLTKILFVILFLAWIAFLIFLLITPQPLFLVPFGINTISFYYGTITNTINILRPAGIFIEPGAFSFFICIVAFFREYLRLNSTKTFILLVLGLVTMSLTHIIVLLLFSTIFLKKIKNILLIGILGFIIFLTLPKDIVENISTSFDKIVMSRLIMTGDGKLSGDNRSERLNNAISLIDSENFLIGTGRESYSEERPTDSNPLTILLQYGFFVYILYTAIILLYLIQVFKCRNVIFLIPIILILQRPYLMLVCYSISYITPLFLILSKNNK